MKILVGCEESQVVTIELRKLGHDAFSCDLLPCSGGHPEWHYQQDIFEIIDKDWDIGIFFPPCTDLAVSGARHFARKIADGSQRKSIDFFMKIANCNIPKIAIENPIGIMSTKYRKPDQIIQPWQFGDEATKTTCIWINGLPKLKATNIVSKGKTITSKTGKKYPEFTHGQIDSNGKKIGFHTIEMKKLRSKTFPGIAKAMAEQWTNPNGFQEAEKAGQINLF